MKRRVFSGAMAAFLLFGIGGSTGPSAGPTVAHLSAENGLRSGALTGGSLLVTPTHEGGPWTHVDLSDPSPTTRLHRLDLAQVHAAAGASRRVLVSAVGSVPSGDSHVPGLTGHVSSDCSGTETNNGGNRVQAIYAHEQGRPDRYPTVLPNIKNILAEIDDIFAVSTQTFSQTRRVRWVQDTNCSPQVLDLTLPSGSIGSVSETTFAAVRAAGYDAANRKYLIFADYSTMLRDGSAAGEAEFFPDDSPTDNKNDGKVSAMARVDIWSYDVAGHELMHTLGSVNGSAPHHTDNGHCTDGIDMMCYSDGSPQHYSDMACRTWVGYDCQHDDYFNPSPPAGSYLDTHWNTARSTFLAALPTPIPPPATVYATVDNRAHRGPAHRITGIAVLPSGQRVVRGTLTLEQRVAGSHRWAKTKVELTTGQGIAGVTVRPRRHTFYRWVLTACPTYRGAVSRRVQVGR